MEEDRSAFMSSENEGSAGRKIIMAPKIEDNAFKKFKDIEEIKKELEKREPLRADKLKQEFRKDRDLRNVLFAVVLHPVSRYKELMLEDEDTGEFVGRHQQAYNMLYRLKRLGLVNFISIHDAILKKAGGKN